MNVPAITIATSEPASEGPIPDYAALLQVAEPADADARGWSWDGPEDFHLADCTRG